MIKIHSPSKRIRQPGRSLGEERAHALDVYTNLFNDAEPEEYVARLGEQRIRESRVEHVRLGEEAQSEIFLRKQPAARNQVL